LRETERKKKSTQDDRVARFGECYDFKNIFAEKFSENIDVLSSSYC
jgi:hypothetical protein